MTSLLLAALLALASVESETPIVVTRHGNDVGVRAEGAYLDEVLERLAEHTAMELDWPKPRARPRVVARIDPRPVSEVVRQLFEGLRFNYAMRLGTDGRVALLVVLDAAAPPESAQELPPGKRGGGRSAPR